jgi:hemolysin activation/secretion protein
MTFDATRVQPISGPFSLEVAFSGQLSADALLASEEFGIGGPNFGRGYDPSEITGDSGAAGRFELQFNDTLAWAVIEDYQLYGFYDVGKVWNRDIQAGGGEDKTATLASTGIGARFNGPYDLSGNLEVAFPMTRDVLAQGQDGDNPRLYFGLNKRF